MQGDNGPEFLNSEKYVSFEKDTVIQDLECSLCLKLFYEPVSLICGHTFCRACLRRALIFKPHCPLCRVPCFMEATSSTTNKVVSKLIAKLFPLELREREDEMHKEEEAAKQAPVRVPIFFLPMIVFPNQPVQLRIFEPRYLIMINRCLEANRRFGIQSHGSSRGVIIEISDVQHLRDGNLFVKGSGRDRFLISGSYEVQGDAHGLHYAHVERVEDEKIPVEVSEEVHQLRTDVRDKCMQFFQLLSRSNRNQLISRCGAVPSSRSSSIAFWACSALRLPDSRKISLRDMTDEYQRLKDLNNHLGSLDERTKPTLVFELAPVTTSRLTTVRESVLLLVSILAILYLYQ